MKKTQINTVYVSLCIILLLLCCFSALTAAGEPVRIMPLGDSITRGWYGSPNSHGYRKPLYDRLTNAGHSFDFVGSQTDGNFADPHHEGRDGWHADTTGTNDILGQVYNWLTANPADIVLLHIGTNDITAGGQNAGEVNAILDEIDRFSTDIKVILALIINRQTYNSATTQYNIDVNNMAQSRIAAGDDILVVNMEPALNYATDMADNLHPNDAGYAKMADVWFNALDNLLNESVFAISGYVFEADGSAAVEGVLIQTDDNDINSITDANGFYELWVDYGRSSIVTPQKDGYFFDPNSTYINVTHDYNDVNYAATLMTFVICGYVIENNAAPISDVNVSAQNGGGPWTSKYGGGSALTDATGYYEISADYNWSGTVTPGKFRYSFGPAGRYYEDVNENWTANQDYTGTLLIFRITGCVKNVCNTPISGVLVSADNGASQSLTDANGCYEVWVSDNWSGTVTLSKAHYTFSPPGRVYTDVLEDKTGQDYSADNIYDLDCDGSIGYGDVAVIHQNWLEIGSNVPGDIHKDEDNIVNLADFADFAGVWLD